MGYDASIGKSYGGVVYNTMMALICRMFWFTKNENGMENERADHRRPPLVKTTVKVLQDRPRRTINVRPNAGSSYKKRSHKLYEILVEMKKGNSLVVRQLHEMSGENELMRNRLVHLENSRVARATVASDNAKLFEKLNGFVEILSRTTTPTNDDVKIGSTCRCDDGSHNDTTVYEGFDKKLEKLQMTMDDQESLLRLNWNTNGEIDGDGHGKKEPNSDYRSSKSDFYQMRYEMQSLREDVARNTTCIRKSLQDVVETMTAERNARDSQQSTYVETVYSNPPPQVHSRPRPPVISTRPQTVISTRPQTVISTSPPPPMTSVPRPPTPPPATILPPPPPPATILPPLARTLKKVFRQIDITVEELQAVPLRTPDGKPNIIKIRHSDR